MLRFLRFIAYGLAFVLVPEFTNLIVINQIPAVFWGALVVYAVMLGLGYGVQLGIDRVLREPLAANLTCIVFFGIMGLCFEWVLVGNSPVQNPDALQWGMFVYWVGFFMIPRILVDGHSSVRPLAQRIIWMYLIYSIVHMLITLMVPVPLLSFYVPLLWTVVYTAFGVFYWQYIRLLKVKAQVKN